MAARAWAGRAWASDSCRSSSSMRALLSARMRSKRTCCERHPPKAHSNRALRVIQPSRAARYGTNDRKICCERHTHHQTLRCGASPSELGTHRTRRVSLAGGCGCRWHWSSTCGCACTARHCPSHDPHWPVTAIRCARWHEGCNHSKSSGRPRPALRTNHVQTNPGMVSLRHGAGKAAMLERSVCGAVQLVHAVRYETNYQNLRIATHPRACSVSGRATSWPARLLACASRA